MPTIQPQQRNFTNLGDRKYPETQSQGTALGRTNSPATKASSASTTQFPRANRQRPTQLAPNDAVYTDSIASQKRAEIASICASVVTEIRQTLGWAIEINPGLQVVSTTRRSLKRHLQHDYQVDSAVQRFILSRVMGVLYIPSMKKIVIIDEVARRWHPDFLAHEITKATVRLSLALYADREAEQDNGEVLHFENKIDQLYSIEYRYRRSVRSMASFLAAHAQFVANKLRPTQHTPPITQKAWGVLVWFIAYTYYKVRGAGVRLAENSFGQILAHDRTLVSRIYAHIRMAEVYYGGVGMIRINSATKATADDIEKDLAFLYSLNPDRGSVAYQIEVGRRARANPELRASDLPLDAASSVV